MSALMIFAAGFGKRLNPLTLDVPKSLVPIQGIPVLDYILKSYYKKTALSSVAINTHYKAEMIREFIRENPQYKISESFEENKILGTGKGLFFAQSRLQGENFWVQNADILCNFEPQKFMDFHLKNKAIVTLAVSTKYFTPSAIIVDKANRVCAFERIKKGEKIKKGAKKSNSKNQAKTFCGIHCISKKIFDFFSFEQVPESIIELYRILLQRGEKIISWDIEEADWVDIGTPEKLEWASQNIHLFT